MTDPLCDIHHYSPTFTINQVLKFIEKKGLHVSRAMIQNYIRAGLLPPPTNRMYKHEHLAALIVILRLKGLFDIQTIKEKLTPYMNKDGLPLDKYKWLTIRQKEVMDLWLSNIAPTVADEPEDIRELLIMSHMADIYKM